MVNIIVAPCQEKWDAIKDAKTEAELNPNIRIQPPLSMLSFLTEVMVLTFTKGYIWSTKIKKLGKMGKAHMTVDEITHLK